MSIIQYPQDASELIKMLDKGEIDIFDALEYAPFFASNEYEMEMLRIRAKARARVRDMRATAREQTEGESNVQQAEE